MAYWSQLLELPDDRTAATAARLERQRVLRSGDHQFVFLLAEQTLRTWIGTAEIMVEQMQRAARYGRSARALILKARDELLQ